MRILLADDDLYNRMILVRMLEFAEFDVLAVNDGFQLIAQAAEFRPDLILLDLSMPNLDGWQTLRALRLHEELAKVPVAAVTAHALEGDRERVLEAGFQGYIAKPFEYTTLLELISSLTDQDSTH